MFLDAVGTVLQTHLGPGVPIPHAEEIKKMIISQVLNRPSEINGGNIINYILGKDDEEPDPLREDLDKGVFDIEKLKKYTAITREKSYEYEMNVTNTRRGALDRESADIAKSFDQKTILTIMDLIEQTLFGIREELNRTRPFRKRFKLDPSFQIGVLYGSIMQKKLKLWSLYSRMRLFKAWVVPFMFYLINYEKILHLSIDLEYAVKKIFIIDESFKEIMMAARQAMKTDTKPGKYQDESAGRVNITPPPPPPRPGDPPDSAVSSPP